MCSELANADLLPLKVQRYSAAVSSFSQILLDTFGERWRKKNVNIGQSCHLGFSPYFEILVNHEV